jgi:hygromycin-B 4-O-kinase
MMRLLDGIAVPRSFVHGSFSAYNVLVENGKVSAVLDWQDARFGDPLFDLASMDYWPTGCSLVDLYERYCADLGVRHNDYHPRVTACKYYQALGGMMYYAKVGNQDAYSKVVRIADGLEAGIDG